MVSTSQAIEVFIFVITGLFYIVSLGVMFSRRRISPVKEHNRYMVAFQGLLGWLVISALHPLPDIVGLDRYSCSLYFWAFIFMIPAYRLPLLVSCLDLYNQYLIGDTLIRIGEERRKTVARIENQLELVTARLVTLRERLTFRFKAKLLTFALIPSFITAGIGLAITGDTYHPGHYSATCKLGQLDAQGNNLIIVYCLVGAFYLGISAWVLYKLRIVKDAFHIKDEILLVFKVQFAFLILFLISFLVTPLFNILIANSLSPNWFFQLSILTTHVITCVVPTMETYGIVINCEGDTEMVSDSHLTLASILSDPAGLQSFSKHLVREFSIENIEFWKEVASFRADVESNPACCQSRAEILIDRYIRQGSENWLNLSAKCRKELEDNIARGTVTAETFDAAQHEIYLFMNADSFERYKKSDLFADFVKAREKSKSRKRSLFTKSSGHKVKVHSRTPSAAERLRSTSGIMIERSPLGSMNSSHSSVNVPETFSPV